jgi:SAM-dependent methyltransferase
MRKTKDSASQIEQLKMIVDRVGPQNVYRPIYDHESKLITKGLVPISKELIEDFSSLSFKGKSVVDLGCNFGFFSFLVKRLGAAKVMGVDVSPAIIAGCNILKSIYGISDVEFVADNIESPNANFGKFDVVMLIDYFGKHSIRKYKVKKLLSNLELLTQHELLLVIRPIYKIREDLGVEPGELAQLYPKKYINDNYFKLIQWLQDHLDKDWTMHPISALPGYYQKRLRLIQFLRRYKQKNPIT